MKHKLTPEELASLLPSVQKVLETGVPWKDDALHYPAGAIIAAVLSIKGMKKVKSEEGNGDGFDTNGWQYDWWQQFTYKEKKYTLSGSGFNGGHAFNLADV